MDSITCLAPVLHQLVENLERKVPYASAFVSSARRLNVLSSTRDERVSETGPSTGAVFTAWNGEYFDEEASGDLSNDGLAAAAKRLSERVVVRAASHVVPVGSPRTIRYATPQEVELSSISLEEKLEKCRKAKERASALHPTVVEANAGYSEELAQTLFVDRASDLSQSISRIHYNVYIVYVDGDAVRYDREGAGGTGGFELASLSEKQWEGLRARIPGLLKATPVLPGYYDVVVSPGTAGLVAHEAFGHGVETDMFLKGRAKSREYIGKRVGSEHVDLFDDPTYPGGFATYAFDDQGEPASKTQILKKGIFVQGLTDLNSAMRLGIKRTANGRRQDTNKAYARMTNTYFGPGDDSLEDMIASVDHGIYLGNWDSGMEDPKDWGVQCIVAWGQTIEKGKLTGKHFTNIGLTGYVPDLLQSVTMVGNDIEISGGGCGKGYKEFISVGDGGPHLRMKARLG